MAEKTSLNISERFQTSTHVKITRAYRLFWDLKKQKKQNIY